jgi:undecaprenyl-diphosphatase
MVNIIFGLLLCFARVYVGAHYPGDVVAGLLLGALVVVLMSLFRPLAYRVADLAERTPFGVLVRRPPA